MKEGPIPYFAKSGPRSMKKEAIVGSQVVGGGHEGKQFFKIGWTISMDTLQVKRRSLFCIL